MASKKTGPREPPTQINMEELLHIISQQFRESASRKSQLDSSDRSPETSSDWFKKHENRVKVTQSVNETSISTAGKRVCSVGIDQQHDSDFKKARRESITDPELKYRCSFCSQRFPSLTNVRDHTRACHREENERRKEERLSTSSTKTTVHKNVEPELGPKLTQNPESHIYLFRCIACKFANISYDHMIEHCQNHVIKFENPEANVPCGITKKYIICGEKFEIDFDTYNECADGLNHSYTFINCDYNLLKQDKWPGIFTNVPKSEIDKINCTSIYYFTRIIRLTSRKKPASVPFMVFQCKKCMKYIDPQSILAHVQENSCNETNADYPCHICKKPFLNENTMYLHHKRHKAADNLKVKFRVVLFNNYDDDFFNALLLKAHTHTMNIVPCKATQQRLSSDFTLAPIEVKNNQTNQKVAIDVQSAPSGSRTGIVSYDADKKMEFKYDARSLIIQGTKTVECGDGAQNKTISETTSTVTKEVDKVDTVFKCKCELCFHGLEFLLKHLEICHSDSKSTIISCVCGLLFNEQQYPIHYGIHNQGFTKLKVRKITVDEEIVALNNKYKSHVDNKIKQIEYNELCRKAILKLIKTIHNIALSLPHVKGYKKEELKQNTIGAAANRSVGSATDDLIKAIFKTQGTMTDIPIHEVNKDIGNKNEASNTKSIGSGTDDLNTTVVKSQWTMTTLETQTVCKVNKGVDNIKQACQTKTVGSGTDDLNTTVMKSQGTITLPEAQTVCKVNKGVDNIKQACQTKTVGSGTDDLDTTVMKSQRTMTLPEAQTVCKVNKGVDNIKQVCQTKTVGSRTDDLHTTVIKSQGTMTLPETQTVHKVNKGVCDKQSSPTKSVGVGSEDFNLSIMKSLGTITPPETHVHKNRDVDNIIRVSKTKSVVMGTDDLNMSVMESHGTITTTVTQTDHQVNKDLCNTEEEGKTNLSLSRTDDFNSFFLKAQEATEPNIEIPNTVKSAVENLLKFKRIINDINIKHNKLNKKFKSGSDNMEENQSMVESTLKAEMNTVKENTKVSCDTKSISNKEIGNISMTEHEDYNKTNIKECDKIVKVCMNKNEGVNAIEPQDEKNNTFEEITETKESEKDKDIKTADGNVESKTYTEDELLNGPETPIYFDAEESILTDDEDPILLYEDDDVD